MARKNEHASIEEYTHDLRAELRQVGRQELGGLEAVIQGNGYSWMYEYLENIVENNASGSRLPVTELMKTPSRQTAKKTRTVTTAAKDRTNKVNLANSKLLGSPINKSSSSRPPLSPLGGRHLNTVSQPVFEKSPTKSPASKAPLVAAKPDKGKGKATAKKGRAKKNPDGENAAPDTETSASTRSGVSATASARSEGMLGGKPLASSRQASPVPTPPRPPRSPERAAPPALPERAVERAPVEEAADDVVMQGDNEEDGEEEIAREEAEEMEIVVEEAVPTPSSGPTRPRTIDLSVIAEAEEDRTSVTIPAPVPITQSTLIPAPTSPAPTAPVLAPAEPITEPIQAEMEQPISNTASVPTSQPPPPIPARQVRSSWLSKALGGAAPGSTGPQRPSESANRSSIVPGPTRLSTTDYPTMRKSLVQPGVLAKRKSGEGIWDEEEEAEKDAEKRPEKIARVEPELFPSTAPVSSGSSAKPLSATAPPPPAPVIPAEKPTFDRQLSQESFARPTASSTLSRSTAPHTSNVDRVTKALDDIRERQQAKDAAKQKAALSVSIAAPVSAPARSTGTGAGFLYGLGTSLGRSLGLGGAARDPEEEARRVQQEKEEEEEVRRKAKEDLSEIMKKMEQPDMDKEEDEMDMDMEEEEEAVIVVAESRFPSMRVAEQEADELDTDEEAEVNESIEIDEVTSLLGSPAAPVPAPAPATASATPARLRNHIQSTTPQGTPPRSIPAAVIGSTRVLRSSPAAAPAQPRVPRQLDGTIASSSTIHDRIKLFNGSSQVAPSTSEPPAAPHATKTPSLFSPTRSGAKRSDAIEVDLDDSPRRVQAGSTDPAEEEGEEDEEMERPASTISRTTSSASLFGQASTMANKALGVKPTVGQVKSVQLAGSAYKKDLAASERRAQVKEQRIKTIADRKAEEEKKQKERELEEKRLKAAELEKRKKEAEERRAQIAKAKAEKAEREREEREAAEKLEAEAEALRKHKLATSQSKAPMQPAKRVISASSSSTNILNGIAKMKEPAKLTKPSGPINSTHGPSKLVPSTFRTAPAPPETPVNQMSHTNSIRLVGQPQPQQQAQAQADRKPLGPPTRPSAIRASNQAQAIRQSAAVAAQHHSSSSSSALPSHTSVLAQSRLALQSQLEAEASEDIVLPDIASEYSDSGDETDDSPAFKRPQWAESPELRAALAAQASKNPDELFGPIRPLLMDELFKAQQKNKFRSRTSSGNWQRDGLKKEEEEEYARRMGFTTGMGKW